MSETKKKVVTQDEFTEANIEELIASRLSLIEKNEIQLAFLVEDMNISTGKEKVDKEGNVMFDPSTGEPLRWQDSYYVDISFVGGSLAIRVPEKDFSKLEIGKRYLGKGALKTKLVGNFTQFDIKFTKFDLIY